MIQHAGGLAEKKKTHADGCVRTACPGVLVADGPVRRVLRSSGR